MITTEVLMLALVALYGLYVVIGAAGLYILKNLIDYYKARLEGQGELVTALRREIQDLKEKEGKHVEFEEALRQYQDAQRRAEREVAWALHDLERPGLERLQVIWNLGERGSGAVGAAKRLCELFEEPGELRATGTKVHILSSLVRIDPPSAKKCIKLGLKDSHASIRAYSAFLAGQQRIEDAKDELAALVRGDGEPRCVRANAQSALMAMGAQEVLSGVGTGHIYAYVLVKAPRAHEPKIFAQFERLRRTETLGIVEGAVVRGRYDVILEVTAPDIHQFHDFIMNNIQGMSFDGKLVVTLTRTFIVISQPPYLHWTKEANIADTQPDRPSTSWVLIRVPAPQSGGATICLEDVPGVVEAASVYGEADIIIKIQGPNEGEVDKIMAQVRKVPFLYDTETYSVITPVGQHMFDRHSTFTWDEELFIRRMT